MLLGATLVYTAGDRLHGNASAGLAYDLAEPSALGQYQGASVLVSGLARAVGPALLTLVVLDGGAAGWCLLAAVLALAGLATPALTRRALAHRAATAGGGHNPGGCPVQDA